MKKDLLHSLTRRGGVILAVFMLLFTSCAIGHDDETFSSDVRNTQLESPNLENLKLSVSTNSDGEEEFRFEWPVIQGAGGYEFTLYNVDDPDNPVVVGEEKEIIDGCVVKRKKADDTKYKVVVLALGSEKYNNKTALESSSRSFQTLITTYQTIPSGTDLSKYFTQNPIPALSDLPLPEDGQAIEEIAYQLEANGEYTMSSDVALKLTPLTIRGDKINRAKLTVKGNSSFISDGAGFKLKFIDIDMTDYTGKGFITYNETQNTSVVTNGWVAVEGSSQIVSCNITNLSKPILYEYKKKYGLREFIFNDCIIEQNLSAEELFINFEAGAIKDLRMINSTFYNKTQKSNIWIKYGGVRFDKEDNRPNPAWAEAGVTIINSTFWQVAYGKQIFNSNGFGKKANYITIQRSIFVDSGSGQVVRRFANSNNRDPKFTLGQNTYWYKGETPSEETKYDTSGTHFGSDPQLKDPANGDFTVTGADQLTARTGDPRWLPVLEEGADE